MKKVIILLSVIVLASCGRGSERPAGDNTGITPNIHVVDLNPATDRPDTNNYVLIGASDGLYWWNGGNKVYRLRQGGEVKKILVLSYGVVCSADEGILFSSNLVDFEVRNVGLNMKTIKHFTNGVVYFTTEPQDVNDIESDPVNPNNLAACSRSGAFVSTNRGVTWEFLRTPSWSSGVKSVAIYTDDKIHVLLGHPFGGIYRMNYSARQKSWEKFGTGMFEYEDVYEEVSEIKAITDDNGGIALYAANNFTAVIQKYDKSSAKWFQVYRSRDKFDLIESLSFNGGNVNFVSLAGVRDWISADPTNASVDPELTKLILKLRTLIGKPIECVTFVSNGAPTIELSSLWILNPPQQNRYASTSSGKRGIYLQAGYADNANFMKRLYTLMNETGLNMITIDMKDDTGNLRFTPQSEYLKQMGTSHYPVDIDTFIKESKARGIYLVARIVLFKDMRMYNYSDGKFAVKDSVTGRPWRGLRVEDGATNQMGEYWIDPYSEEIWEYNVEVCKELIQRGFDEVQFDYIRFPTDGINLWRANFTHKDPGMDKESAVMSFLSYARQNIDAPISVDIYGSNGWHRMGGVTGQDVEMLCKYVDVICPMYYPSHFGQDFLSYEPADQRPYRIYYFGTLRNYYIAKQTIIVRPWVQAFQIGVSYDRRYYGPDYVRNEIRGVHDSLNFGFTYWNSASDYSIIRTAFLTNGG